MKSESKFRFWAVYWYHTAIAIGALMVAYVVLSAQEAPAGHWFLFAAAAVFVAVLLLLEYRAMRQDEKEGFAVNELGDRGVFFPLIRFRFFLSCERGMSQEQKSKKFAALYTAVHDKFPILRKADNLSYALMMLLFIHPLVGDGTFAEWAEDNIYLWGACVSALKFYVWDAIAAFVLYRLMRKEEYNFTG